MLKDFALRWFPDPAIAVVMAANGYPGDYVKGSVIGGLDEAANIDGVEIFHAGTRRDGGRFLANGGRVLDVTASGKTLAEARARAYAAVDKIAWPEGFCRSDIGARAVERQGG
jgi:phosphoribosylamine--glycine ligase